MRRTLALALVSVPLLALPAAAMAPAADLDDDHLYLRQQEDHYSIYHLGGRRRWGWRMPYVTHFVDTRTFITKGDLPISNERFIDLMDRSQADPGFSASVATKESDRSNWGWATLGSLGVLGLGIGLTVTDPFYANPQAAPTTYTAMAGGLTVAGLLSSLITSGVWSVKLSRPLFSAEEAADAIKAYNRKLDGQRIGL